jgi:hypothetical protein
MFYLHFRSKRNLNKILLEHMLALKWLVFFSFLLLYWGYIVTFTKVLIIYHSCIHPSHSWNSFTRSYFSFAYMSTIYFHHIHLLIPFPYILPPSTVPTLKQDLFFLISLIYQAE